MPDPQDPIRQMLIQARRTQILTAAADIFSQKGFAGATVREIAARAGVAEGTLYNYFGGKREILQAVADEMELPRLFAMLEEVELGNREAMVAMVEMGLDLSEARLPFIRTVIREAWLGDRILIERAAQRLARIHQRLADYIAKSVEAGVFRPIDPDMGARMVLSMFTGLLLPSLRSVNQPPWSQQERQIMARTMVSTILDGILVQRA